MDKLQSTTNEHRKKRSKLLSQRDAIKINIDGGLAPSADDISELKEFFPDLDVDKLQRVERFHSKMSTILTAEMTQEVNELNVLIEKITGEIRALEEEQRKLGVPTHVSKKFLDQTVALRKRIDLLTEQNKGFDEQQQLKQETKDAKAHMEAVRGEQLAKVETMVNQEMVRMNDFIYDAEQYAPEIHFADTQKGNATYKFGCKWNTGTGENYKNMIIYDLRKR